MADTNTKYTIDKKEIEKLNSKIKREERKCYLNWGLSFGYILFVALISAFIASWGYLPFSKNPDFKDVPSLLNIFLTFSAIVFAFFHSWKTYLSSKSLKITYSSIKTQYEDRIGKFEKCKTTDEAKQMFRTLVFAAETIYAEKSLANDAEGFNDAVDKIANFK